MIFEMKRMSIFFLAFMTFWMSTWMVTDIHDWSVADAGQPHPVLSLQAAEHLADNHSNTQDHSPHCGVCIYDHGGHMGQTLASSDFAATSIAVQNTLPSPRQADFWYSRNTLPKLRPPIA